MTTNCDHARCLTKFCPYCGDPVGGHDAGSLRAYIATQVQRCRLDADRIKGYMRMDDDLKERRLEQNAKVTAKWQQWLKVLDDLIGGMA